MNTKFYLTIIVTLLMAISCSTTSKESCDTPEVVTYSNQIGTLVETKCFECHAPDVYKTEASRVKIYDYASLRDMAESGQLIGSINHDKGYIAMPYRKGEKIDDCSISLFQAWVDSGMKE